MNVDLSRRLYRSRQHRIIAGVAGGIAEYFEVDPTLTRVLLILALLLSTGPFAIVVYAILVFLIPLRPEAPQTG